MLKAFVSFSNCFYFLSQEKWTSSTNKIKTDRNNYGEMCLNHWNFFLSVDKCANCDENANCVGGKCKCKAGFIGNGYECIRGIYHLHF